MKKSEHYKMAMTAVLLTDFRNEVKLEILETLMEDRKMALLNEKYSGEGDES